MIEFFLEACDYISSGKNPPYYIETKVRDLSPALLSNESHVILNYSIKSNNTSDILRYFSKNRAIKHIAPSLYLLHKIPQNKKISKNAFEHTLRVIDLISEPYMKWSGYFHDLGKYNTFTLNKNFQNHEEYSLQYAEQCCLKYNIANSDKICSIVKHHMEPLAYQRNPNWSDSAVERFIERCKKEYVLDIIEFSVYDKQAEQENDNYIQPLLELKERVLKCLN